MSIIVILTCIYNCLVLVISAPSTRVHVCVSTLISKIFPSPIKSLVLVLVQGKEYFKCEENYGIFVRQSQISIIEDKSSGIPSPSQPKVSRLPVGSGIPQPGRTPASSKKEKVLVECFNPIILKHD